MERKLILCRINHNIVSSVLENGKIVELHVEKPDNRQFHVGDIYIGKVKNIVKNIQAAFIEIQPGVECYYQMNDNPSPIFTKKIGKKPLCIGDELLVQIEREAVKTKVPTVTSNLSLTGKYIVLTHGNTQIGVSSKFPKEQRTLWKEALADYANSSYGFIVRTNAAQLSLAELKAEIDKQIAAYEQLKLLAQSRTCFSCVKQAPREYLATLKNIYQDGLQEILIEDAQLFDEVFQFLKEEQQEDTKKLIRYEDSLLPLHKLYSVEHVLEEALAERVWMKSGAYLVIQPTEALTVIDVNSGKCVLKKNDPDAFYKINREAAAEAARQIRLRNLSGIILIDFINMEASEEQQELLSFLKNQLQTDPIRTDVIDITKLQLVEVTRRKVRKPLHEVCQKRRS